ncbi:BZ3500_MvSof-1268-A1-R1_Chr10-2g03044 [Microbotryum saponariae]|uniref:BZ3500_MvSof-1268-A1-R1_Chr10-2g03044 protein n=1 Tax=Microbotryum saponariae TaxID=289078 RepID=A0A2X0KR87_9BASI|nr:BZ3501_MvSof-1269-A2-R1_Chr10-2g02630 [Microbotryum saponariae]SDA01982.1 BZ3500_MvSof-1268-A1-R1_Chr10-2g03044 [Microbotryum saponariae]
MITLSGRAPIAIVVLAVVLSGPRQDRHQRSSRVDLRVVVLGWPDFHAARIGDRPDHSKQRSLRLLPLEKVASWPRVSFSVDPRRFATVPSAGERAIARADRIANAMEGKEYFSQGLCDYFFGNPTAWEVRNKVWSKNFAIGTEEAMAEVIAAVNKITGDNRLVACKNSPNYIGVAPDRIETTEKTADVVLLTRASIKHDPTLPNVWALPKHARPDAKDEGKKGKGKGKGKGKATAVGNGNGNGNGNGKDDGEMKEDNIDALVRTLVHVAAVGEAKGGDADARKHLLRRLSALLATPIREFAIGFTLRHNRLKVYLLNACGLFHTKEVVVSEENGFLSTFFYRLVGHDDFENGLLATTNSLDDRQGPYTPCDGFFPAAAPEFVGGPVSLREITIVRLLFRRQTECGRATSTYEITVRDGTTVKTHAMSIAWVEQSRNTDLAEIRNFVQAKRPRGLAPLVAVFRGEYETLRPAFLDRDHTFDKLVPRAREVVIHEERYRSLDTIENTKSLARVLEGAIEGHRALWNHGYIHRDVSYGNIMVDKNKDGILLDYHLAVKNTRLNEEEYRLNRSGTLPYMSWLLLDGPSGGVTHERWHDVESFFYVACHRAFQSTSSSTLKVLAIETPEAKHIWNYWNAGDLTGAANAKFTLQRARKFDELVQARAPGWDRMKEFLTTLKEHCWLHLIQGEEEDLKDLWESQVMSYDGLLAGLRAFYQSP